MDSLPVSSQHQQVFWPYESNGGTLVAIAGDNFVAIGCDTRMSTPEYVITTRNQNKLYQLTDKTIFGTTGCGADSFALYRLLKIRLQSFNLTHNKVMSTNSISQLLSNLMYDKRFFPYYVSNLIAGLDSNNKGIVINYDPLGSSEYCTYRACGTAGPLIQPVLDNQVGLRNQANSDTTPISKERAVSIIYDALITAAEREIFTGDNGIISVITVNGTETKTFKLRRD